MSAQSPPTPRSSAQGVVLVNTYTFALFLFVQLVFPHHVYSGPFARAVSRWTGLPLVELVPENSPAHALLLAYGSAVLLHMWMAAKSTRKHAHASTALMEIIYIAVALPACLPFTPHHCGSSITLIGVIPNTIFPALICWKGKIGIKDFIALLSGDEAIGRQDRIAEGRRE